MSVAWTITGETGKALDATSRTLEAIGAEDPRVRFQSAGMDKLTWRTPIPAGGTVIAPEMRQKVTLWRDGVRFFQGHVIRRRPVFEAEQWTLYIEVAGPWWWLEQIALTSTQTDQAGSTATRSAFVFGTGSLATSFSSLVSRAVTLGAPIAAGTIATMYDVPRITVTGQSIAATFLDLLRWVPDAMLWFDHSATTPTLNVTRRRTALASGSATTRTVTIGTDGVMEVDLQPQIELEVSQVRIDSVTRDSQGRGIWSTLSAGSASTGRNQIVVVSGPEAIDTTLPPDQFDSVVVRSKALDPAGSPVLDIGIFETYDQRIRAAGAVGELKVGPPDPITYSGTTYSIPSITALAEREEGGALPSGYNRWLSKGEPRDWWTKDGIGWVKGRVQATLYWEEISPWSNSGGGFNINTWEATVPEWVEALGMIRDGGAVEGGGPGGAFRKRTWFYYTTAVLVPIVNTSWTTDTTLYRSEDYSYVAPPSGLATNLLTAQQFVPYQGRVEIVHADIPAGNPVGQCLNVAGDALGELASIRALIQTADLEIFSGRERLTCGASPRLAYEDLVRRYRRSGYDVYDYVSNPGLTLT